MLIFDVRRGNSSTAQLCKILIRQRAKGVGAFVQVHVAGCDTLAKLQGPVCAHILVGLDGIVVKSIRCILAGAEQGAGVAEKRARDDARTAIWALVDHFLERALRVVVLRATTAKGNRADHDIGFLGARNTHAFGSAEVAVVHHDRGLGDSVLVADDMHLSMKQACVDGSGRGHEIVDGISLEWADVCSSALVGWRWRSGRVENSHGCRRRTTCVEQENCVSDERGQREARGRANHLCETSWAPCR